MSKLSKVLLLTDIPPCKNLTSGLVLDQLCRFLPRGHIACFAVVNPDINVSVASDLDWMPLHFHRKPRENWNFLPKRMKYMNKFISYIMGLYNELIIANQITCEVVSFAAKIKPDVLWCVVQGQTEVNLARKVADALNIPLLLHIWDPLYLWMDINVPDNLTKNRIIKKFENTLRCCNGFFAASWAMAEKYSNDYGVRAVSFLPSLDKKLAKVPATAISDSTDFIIGSAGKMYPVEVWNALFEALNSVDWKIENRNIKIRLLAQDAPLSSQGKMNVEFLGWRSQEEVIQLLSETDMLYCPYWFDPYYEIVTKLSFPGKLTTFLATGKPVMFHGPLNASPACFLRDNNAGLLCHSMVSSEIIATITQLIHDQIMYKQLSSNGRNAFDRYLTLNTLRKSFAEFLQVDVNCLVSLNETIQ